MSALSWPGSRPLLSGGHLLSRPASAPVSEPLLWEHTDSRIWKIWGSGTGFSGHRSPPASPVPDVCSSTGFSVLCTGFGEQAGGQGRGAGHGAGDSALPPICCSALDLCWGRAPLRLPLCTAGCEVGGCLPAPPITCSSHLRANSAGLWAAGAADPESGRGRSLCGYKTAAHPPCLSPCRELVQPRMSKCCCGGPCACVHATPQVLTRGPGGVGPAGAAPVKRRWWR